MCTSTSVTYDFDQRWSLLVGVGYKRLIGDAADSPIVESEDQFSATFGLTYRFSTRSLTINNLQVVHFDT